MSLSKFKKVLQSFFLLFMLVSITVQNACGYFIIFRFATTCGFSIFICSLVIYCLSITSCFLVYMYFISSEMVNKILYYTILYRLTVIMQNMENGRDTSNDTGRIVISILLN